MAVPKKRTSKAKKNKRKTSWQIKVLNWAAKESSDVLFYKKVVLPNLENYSPGFIATKSTRSIKKRTKKLPTTGN